MNAPVHLWLLGIVISGIGIFGGVPEASAQARETRGWTSNGKTLRGILVSADEETATLRLANGRTWPIPIDKLSEEDQAYLAELRERGQTIAFGKMPEETDAGQHVEVEGGPKVFTTPHFQFDCSEEVTRGFISEAARVFEGTLLAIERLPLGIDPKPAEGKKLFRTLFLSRQDFDTELARPAPPTEEPKPATGGSDPRITEVEIEVFRPLISVAGVYIPARKEALVPFTSLGAEKSGSKMTLRRSSDTGTLIHEIAHQVMHDWLVLSPVWFSEGFAEYISAIPYQNGRFEFRNAEKGLKERLQKSHKIKDGETVDMIHPSDLLRRANHDWAGGTPEYRSAMLLVYYFMHLDQPDNPGASLASYFHLLKRGKRIADAFEVKRIAYNREVDAYNAALDRFRAEVDAYNARVNAYNRQITARTPADKLIKVGDIPIPPSPPEALEWPGELTVVAGDSSSVDLGSRVAASARPALVRGRDLEALAEQIRTAYAGIGITIKMLPPRRVLVQPTFVEMKAADLQPLRLGIPKSFWWEYKFEPEPGKRQWDRTSPTTFVESYPSGKTQAFEIKGAIKVGTVSGTLVETEGGGLQVFIPDRGSALMRLMMRTAEGQQWVYLGEMQGVE